ncbi:unnamed protein product [Darwinula stevensoni]|uniref:C-type lectin domain-containing protein n=1 Tax=Darwinula stevensoni TaxID=69355 RepID=A0A7R9ADW1_9CRUS|nr:unnamed protein product [Darwinula stevensoni]CAG0901346.1 unnamed protein product [Darwinula stevensoni]
MDYEWAKTTCENDGARLAMETDNATASVIEMTANSYGQYLLWLGCNDAAQDGNWICHRNPCLYKESWTTIGIFDGPRVCVAWMWEESIERIYSRLERRIPSRAARQARTVLAAAILGLEKHSISHLILLRNSVR